MSRDSPKQSLSKWFKAPTKKTFFRCTVEPPKINTHTKGGDLSVLIMEVAVLKRTRLYQFDKLTSVFHGIVLLLIMNFVMALSKQL